MKRCLANEDIHMENGTRRYIHVFHDNKGSLVASIFFATTHSRLRVSVNMSRGSMIPVMDTDESEIEFLSHSHPLGSKPLPRSIHRYIRSYVTTEVPR
jgi:hypothetical protein